jgi:ribosome biogenesis GTPase
MSGRKLTRRQSWRVNKVQKERLKRAARRDAMIDEALAAGELGPEQPGLITAHFGNQVEVSAGELSQRCHLRANLEGIVTGDRVAWCAGDETGVVVARDERDSELMRPDGAGKLKPVAANIDQIIIVLAPQPPPHASLVDRYLVASEAVAIPALILLNKIDLIDADNRGSIEALLAPYPQLGYPLLRASCKASDGLLPLREALVDHTSVFVGQSGVGKSSLVNALLPGLDLRVGALSETHGKGMHTTTTARMLALPDGGAIIDSPGIREFGLWHMSREQVAEGFREFKPYLGHCRFRDCLHESEPGCALLAAAEAGSVSQRRLDSYRQIVASLSEQD